MICNDPSSMSSKILRKMPILTQRWGRSLPISPGFLLASCRYHPAPSQPVCCWWSDRQVWSHQPLPTTIDGFLLCSGSGERLEQSLHFTVKYLLEFLVSPTGPQALPRLQGPAQSLAHSRNSIGICLITERMDEWANEHPTRRSVRAWKGPRLLPGWVRICR